MISIIISSYRDRYFKLLERNIDETIGDIEYEIIRIENRGVMSISQAYNKGAESAKFNYLLFIHEDVQFLLQDWGRELIRSYDLENLGLLGLAGGIKKSKLPTGHDLGIATYRKVFVSHSVNEEIKNGDSLAPIRTKTLDGVFLAMTKSKWRELLFDETIKGFHFYDLDISLRASRNYQNYVIPSIPLRHFSKGDFSDKWVVASLNFHVRNYCFDNLTVQEIYKLRQFWYKRLISEKVSLKNRLRYLWRMGVDRYSGKDALQFLFSKEIYK